METGAAPNARQRLPDDLVELICVQAAHQDRHSAYALALTSRAICEWTATARWQTIVITSTKQLLSFWKAIYAVPDEIYEAFHLQLQHSRSSAEHDFSQVPLTRASNAASKLTDVENRRTVGISYPADGKPHRHVRNLFIDISLYHHAGQLPAAKVLANSCLVFMASGIFMRSCALSDPRNILARWSCKDRSGLQVVSLGIDETDAVNWSALSGIKIRELTLVLRKDYSGDLHVDMTPSIKRLHVIGTDPESELTGVEPPWLLFKSLTTPFVKNSLSPVPSLSHRKLTHLRFDTRRFSLKPAEITAKRLRPLLQECTIAPTTSPAGDHLTGREAAAAFQFDGPRHAAPARGAGSYMGHQLQSRLTPVAHLAQHDAVARYLCDIGIGCMDFLQVAWEPMAAHPAAVKALPWFKRKPVHASPRKPTLGVSEISDAETRQADEFGETGGWPREIRGAWAERSEKSSALGSFAIELRDAISTLYGWHAHGIEAAGKFCAQNDREQLSYLGHDNQVKRNSAFSPDGAGLMVEPAQPGLTQQDEDELHSLALLVKANVPNWRDSHLEWAEEDLDFLRFGIRAPRSLIHLGGQAAFRSEDRLRLFEDRASGGKGAWP